MARSPAPKMIYWKILIGVGSCSTLMFIVVVHQASPVFPGYSNVSTEAKVGNSYIRGIYRTVISTGRKASSLASKLGSSTHVTDGSRTRMHQLLNSSSLDNYSSDHDARNVSSTSKARFLNASTLAVVGRRHIGEASSTNADEFHEMPSKYARNVPRLSKVSAILDTYGDARKGFRSSTSSISSPGIAKLHNKSDASVAIKIGLPRMDSSAAVFQRSRTDDAHSDSKPGSLWLKIPAAVQETRNDSANMASNTGVPRLRSSTLVGEGYGGDFFNTSRAGFLQARSLANVGNGGIFHNVSRTAVHEFKSSAQTDLGNENQLHGVSRTAWHRSFNATTLKKAVGEDIPPGASATGSIVNAHSFSYVIKPSVTCRNRDVELVICVPVSRGNSARRQVIRETWGSFSSTSQFSKKETKASTGGSRSDVTKELLKNVYSGVVTDDTNIIVIFFIGSSPLPLFHFEQQKDIEMEAEIYGDILQEDYIDSYENLTLKSLSVIKWVSTHCPNTRYVAKVDDDMYINIPLLLKALHNATDFVSVASKKSYPLSSKQFVTGRLISKAKPIRTNTSKWYTTESQYNKTFYPNYTSGTAYAMSGGAAKELFQTSHRIPLFWMEDIYITGMCRSASKMILINDSRFSFGKPKASGCTFRNQITGHRYSSREIRTIHAQLLNVSLKC